ncbi:IclR family transcriptional regulator [Halobium palmae]|uniref:IclR family transcriptional regulator n=1 Tax=Halobium palmae TaxID=1776492 RepID=A0ABD5RW43_9EURY
MTIKECAEALDLANSTVHKHLATGKQTRLVVQEGTEYRLGLGFLTYGVAVQKLFPIYELTQDVMDNLADETGERIWLKVEENGREIPIENVAGEQAIQTDRDIGGPNKMHKTAGGKAILAFLDAERRREILADMELDANTDNTITDREKLEAELEQIRDEGVAYNKSEDIAGVNAVGAPIIDNDGNVHGSLVIAGPEHRLDDERLENELANLVKGTTNEVGINISYR